MAVVVDGGDHGGVRRDDRRAASSHLGVPERVGRDDAGRMRPGADPDTWQPVQSGNYRISEWQAAILLAQFERFPAQVTKREASIEFLNNGLAQVEGLAPMLRRPQVTRQGAYQYAFRYDPEAFNEVPVTAFRRALAAELGTVSETFSRTLAKFREQKLLSVKGRVVTVLAPEKLRALLRRNLGE